MVSTAASISAKGDAAPLDRLDPQAVARVAVRVGSSLGSALGPDGYAEWECMPHPCASGDAATLGSVCASSLLGGLNGVPQWSGREQALVMIAAARELQGLVRLLLSSTG